MGLEKEYVESDDPESKADTSFLWEQAKAIFYDGLGEKKASKIRDSTTLQETIENLQKSKAKASKQYDNHTFAIGGNSVDFKLGNIMKRLELLLQVGDTAMHYAPESVSIVWAAFRMIFTGFLKDAETCELLADAVDQVSDIMFTCAVYAQRYLGRGVMVHAAGNAAKKVLEQIPTVYATVLEFSYETRRLLSSNKLGRSWKSMFGKSQEISKIIDEAIRKRDVLRATADIAFKEAATEVLQDLHGNTKVLQELFDTVETLVVPTLKRMATEQAKDREKSNKEELRKMIDEQQKWVQSGQISELDSPVRQFEVNLRKRHKGTARWILETEEYNKWYNSVESSLLWIFGDGGFGKSIIMSSIIEALGNEITYGKESEPVLLYFFCKIGNDASQRGQKVVLHLLAQLLQKISTKGKDPKTADDFHAKMELVLDAFKEAKEKLPSTTRDNSSLAGLNSTLQPLLDSVIRILETRVYVIVDALDECIDRESGLLEALKTLAKSPANVRVLVSSRYEIDIQHSFGDTYELVEVNASKTEKDVKRYVIDSLRAITRFKPQEKAKASTVIAKKSEGKFRYANVVTEGLNRTWAKLTNFNKIMQELPDGMNEVYRKSLQSLQQDDRKMLITALRWLVCGEGRIDANWVADELQNLYGDDNIPPDSDQEETSDDDVDASDLAEFEQGDDTEAGANEQREIVKDLQRIGRDFLKFNGDIVEFDHKSVRDFVIDDEKLIRHQTFRCPECADRIASYSVYEAGTKHGHLLMTQRILSHLNSPTFQKKFILPQESTAVAEVTTEVVAVDGQDSNGLDTHSAASLTEEEPSIATDLAAELNNFSGERTTNLAESGADDDTKSVASSVSTDAGPILAPTYNFEEVDGPYESQDLRYELSHWHMHLRAAEEAWPQEDREDDTWEAIYQAVEKFLDPGTPVYGSWLKRIFHWREFKTIDDPFLIASRFGLVNVVKRYLKRNSSKEYVNMVNENNGTALHLACAGKGDLETISVLVAAGVNVHLKDRWECTALLILCSLDSIPLDAVKYLLDHGAEPQVCDDEKLTCLHFAAARGNLEVCKLLLARDEVDVDAEDDSGESPLHHAFRFPNVSGELIQLLLDRKPNVNAQDKDSQAPLYEACSVGNVAGAALLLDYRDGDIRVDINDDEKIFGHTALHASVKASSLELVKLLVSRGADMSLKDKQGHDPIFQAAEEGEDEILAFLLGSWKDRGFDMQFLAQVDINGHTPLHRAAAKGHTACVEVLLQQGDGKHLSMQLNHNGATPLHSAARRGHFASTKLMLDNGADPMARTNRNETPLALAFDGVRRRTSNDELSRFISTITLLVECVPITETGVDVLEWAIEQRLEDLCRLLAPQSNSPNEDGWKPLTLARHLGHTDLASLLIDTGSETMLTPTRLMRSDLVTFPVLSDDGLKISCKNKDFFFTGDWTTYYSHGLVLADHPVPASCHHYYFEITLLVYNNDEPCVGVGFTGKYSIQRNRMPGWYNTDPYSFGYHSDDGKLFDSRNPSGNEYATPPQQGDVIGCGLDVESGIIYYTKNGVRLADAFTDVKGRLYPVIGFGLSSASAPMGLLGTTVQVNFGQDPKVPFKYH